MNIMKSKAGFTLVELIVVIAILGILAGIAIPAYSGYIKKAESVADTQDLSAIYTAATSAVADEGSVSTITVTAATGTISQITVSGVTTSVLYKDNTTGDDTWDPDFKMFLNDAVPSFESDGSYKDGAIWEASTGKWKAGTTPTPTT